MCRHCFGIWTWLIPIPIPVINPTLTYSTIPFNSTNTRHCFGIWTWPMGRPQQPCHHRVNILRYLHRLHLLRSSFETQSGGLGRILCPWQFVYFPAVVVWTGYVWRIVLAGHRLDHLLFTCWIRCVITLSTAQQHTRSTPSSYTLSTSLSTHPTNSPHQQTLSIQAAHPIYLNPILIIFLVSLCFMLLLPCCLVVLFFVCLFIFCSVSCILVIYIFWHAGDIYTYW